MPNKRCNRRVVAGAGLSRGVYGKDTIFSNNLDHLVESSHQHVAMGTKRATCSVTVLAQVNNDGEMGAEAKRAMDEWDNFDKNKNDKSVCNRYWQLVDWAWPKSEYSQAFLNQEKYIATNSFSSFYTPGQVQDIVAIKKGPSFSFKPAAYEKDGNKKSDSLLGSLLSNKVWFEPSVCHVDNVKHLWVNQRFAGEAVEEVVLLDSCAQDVIKATSDRDETICNWYSHHAEVRFNCKVSE